jgi:hypothetical protein
VLVAAGAGCASGPQYHYAPQENAAARVSGQPAAYYPIPPASPRGDLRVAALGFSDLRVVSPGVAELQAEAQADGPAPGGPNEPNEPLTPAAEPRHVRAMHVRMLVDDNDEKPWTVDTREQLGELQGDGQSLAAFVAASAGEPPVITVPAGGSVTLDLYYPLPAGMQSASEVPKFDVLWHVRTPDGIVARRTRFERLRIELTPQPDYGYVSKLGRASAPDYAPHDAASLPPGYEARPVVIAPQAAPAPGR